MTDWTDRARVSVSYDREAGSYFAAVLYRAPKSRSIREVKRFYQEADSIDYHMHAQMFCNGFVAALEQMS